MSGRDFFLLAIRTVLMIPLELEGTMSLRILLLAYGTGGVHEVLLSYYMPN